MDYREIRPAGPLDRYVKCFWTLETDLAVAPQSPERILPDGCMEMIFNLADPFRQYNGRGAADCQPLILLVGQMKQHISIEPTGIVRLLGIRFWPGGAYPFLKFPQDEVADRIVDLETAWGRIAREMQSKISEAKTTTDRVRVVETALLAQLSLNQTDDDAILNAVTRIIGTGGRLSVEMLAGSVGMSRRQLDRRFNIRVGITPKLLCRTIRFQTVFRALERNGRAPNWAALAIECGYYDQAHFIKDFKAFAGAEPTSYFAEPGEMSEYFTGDTAMTDFYNTNSASAG